MVFNLRGLGPKNFKTLEFSINGCNLEICDKYTYLGLTFKPSGSFVTAQAELYTKASKAWFAISHIVYQNKKMSVDQALQLIDSVVMPVGLYASEFLTPLALPQGAFQDKTSVLRAWESFPLEKVNQRACRMLLSLHKRASRLACLGELGRHPVLLKGLLFSLKYDWHIRYKASRESLVFDTYQEMSNYAAKGNDCWLSRVRAISNLFKINLHGQMSPALVTSKIKSCLNSNFEIFWKDKINDPKLDKNNISRNKLRLYCQLKSCFKRENYIDTIQNRNQRLWLSRIRSSAHNLAIEQGRYKDIPPDQRFCVYCSDGGPGPGVRDEGSGAHQAQGEVDCELHFLLKCSRFKTSRLCFFKRMELFVPKISTMNELDQLKFLLCPTTPQAGKLVNKFIGIMFRARSDIDSGKDYRNYPTWEPNLPNPFVIAHDIFDSNADDDSLNLENSFLSESFSSHGGESSD